MLFLTRVSNASNATTDAWSSALLVTVFSSAFTGPRVRPSEDENAILMGTMHTSAPKRDDGRIIIHFVSTWNLKVIWGITLPELPASNCQNRIMVCTFGYIAKHDADRYSQDCFYAAVFEREDPTLKSLPLAVQQKQIIVTCNYEARRRGLHKLQLIREARKKCPDVIIVLGEDLTRFRNASKDNYNFLRSYTWSNKVERLGFDEVRHQLDRSHMPRA